MDPNRVLDLVFEAYERWPANDGFAELLRLFRTENFAQVLGFKFQCHAKAAAAALAEKEDGEAGEDGAARAEGGDDDAAREEKDGTNKETFNANKDKDKAPATSESLKTMPTTVTVTATPKSLYVLAATLVRKNLVEMDDLYAHLYPADDVAAEKHAAEVSRRLAAAKKIGVVNLRGGADDGAARGPDPYVVAATPVPDETNQKLGLLRGFLAIGDLRAAASLLERLAELGLDPTEDAEVRDALCVAARDALKEAHARAAPAGCAAALEGRGDVDGRKPPSAEGFPLPDAAFEIIALLGPHVHHDVILFTRIARCLKQHIAWARKRGDDASARRGEDAVGACVLPALGLTASNPGAVNEAW